MVNNQIINNKKEYYYYIIFIKYKILRYYFYKTLYILKILK